MKTQKTINTNNESLIKSLAGLLNDGNAHVSLNDALENINLDLAGKKPNNLPYSIWQLAEHIRIAQWDILEFSRNENHESPEWPGGYWPEKSAPVSKNEWDKCVTQIKSDRKSFIDLLTNAGESIHQPFDYGNGQSLLQEALVLADHTSYHTGEIIILRRLLNHWEK